MRAKIKIVIDVGMIILVLLQMAYHLIADSLHEWLGIMLFVLLILHNILDRKWYSGLFKGKYTQIRFFHTAIFHNMEFYIDVSSCGTSLEDRCNKKTVSRSTIPILHMGLAS